MGKFTDEELSPGLRDRVKKLSSVSLVYVDGTNGNDNNDGGIESPLRTLSAAGNLVSNKIPTNVTVSIIIREGVYSGETLIIGNINGDVVVSGYVGESVKFTKPKPNDLSYNSLLYVTRVRSLSLSNITFDCDSTDLVNTKAFYPIFLYEVNNAEIGNDVIIDGAKCDISKTLHGYSIALYSRASNVLLSNQFKNVGYNVIAGTNSRVVFYGAKLTDAGLTSPHTGSIITNYSLASGSQSLVIEKAESGLFINDINKSAIVETGSNENGTYVKYADGRLVCEGQIVQPTTANSGVANNWTFPHAFVANSVTGFCNLYFNVKDFSLRADYVMKNYLYHYTDAATIKAMLTTSGASVTQTITFAVLAIGRWK